MTRTTFVVRSLLLFLGLSDVMIAGAYNDYEGFEWESEQRLEAVSQRCLADRIIYEKTGTEMPCEVEPIPPEYPVRLELDPEVEFRLNHDPRVKKVALFFKRHKSPVARLAPYFVKIADANHIDWRLLPVIAFLESGGGRKYRHNNIFGWNSGKTKFSSIEEGINSVGVALGTHKHYVNKSSYDKLRTYNVHRSYVRRATLLMRQLGSSRLDA